MGQDQPYFGTSPNDHTGDKLRVGVMKVAANCVDLDTRVTAQQAAVAILQAFQTSAQGNLTDLLATGAVTASIMSYGAIGDGQSHPLSTRFPSLGAAQAVYPAATALTEEIDYHAVRKAIDVASVVGGTVLAPHGRFMMNNAASPACFLQIPEATYRVSESARQVNIKGAGWRSTVFKWPTDYGTNGSNFALCCGDPTGTKVNALGRWGGNYYEGFFEDFAVEGPVPSFTVGVKNRNLSGIGWGSRRHMRRVGCNGFYAGIDVVGDWALIESCYFTYNYYGAYFPSKSSSLYGDVDFHKCFFTSAAMAGIAIGNGGYIQSEFQGCYIGGAPYGIMQESGSTSDTLLFGRFVDCQFEFLGNAAVFDENALGGGTRHLTLITSSFENCPWFYSDTTRLTTGGRGRTALITAKTLQDVRFIQMNQLPPGTETTTDFPIATVINAGSATGVHVEGNLSWITSNHGTSLPFAIVTSTISMTFEDRVAAWSGRMLRMHPSNTCIRGNLLEFTSSSRPSSAGVQPLVGVAMHDATNNELVVAATRGVGVAIINDVTLPASANSVCKKAASGAVQAATDMDDGIFVGLTQNSAAPYILVTLGGKYMCG